MTLEIVVVVEDFLANLAGIFSRGIFRLRSAVDADSMPTQIEAILEKELRDDNYQMKVLFFSTN